MRPTRSTRRSRLQLGTLHLDVDLHVAADELVVLVGPNGAGKSSLLNAVAGLAPIDAGRIVLDGRGARRRRPRACRAAREASGRDDVPGRSALPAPRRARQRGVRAPRAAGCARPPPTPARTSSSRAWVWMRTRAPSPTSSRAVRPSGSRWPGRSRSSRARCSSTSRSPRSTRRPGSTCAACCATSSRRSTAFACS